MASDSSQNGLKLIEQGIKPLVDILNEVPYITTFSSCEGHYDQDNYKKYHAEVLFKIWPGAKPQLKHLIEEVLKQTTVELFPAVTKIFQEYYKIPDNSQLFKHYRIIIDPVDTLTSAHEKRVATDESISVIVDAISNYIRK